ncbi:MAG TPA: archaellin/type IV pilin N-terminal domain-containing protein [Thermoplasmata archaeon]|nr:archaellin/type IV pilin N-terminal domain-containing protein [Thermoplasmata archaeon]
MHALTLGTAARRTGRSRAVSPIIATILLVAITVVLAAVLYVLVSGVAPSSAGNAPIGSQLALGPVVSSEGSKSTKAFCQNGHFCYAVSVAFAGSSITVGDLALAVKDGSGATFTVLANSARIAVVDAAGDVIASTTVKAHNPFAVTAWSSWSNGGTAASPLDSGTTFWVQFGSTSFNPSNQGFTLLADGSGEYTGSVSVPLP